MQVFAAKKAAKKQVVLVQDVANLGKKGEVVGVKAGYYRNFLFPKVSSRLFCSEAGGV